MGEGVRKVGEGVCKRAGEGVWKVGQSGALLHTPSPESGALLHTPSPTFRGNTKGFFQQVVRRKGHYYIYIYIYIRNIYMHTYKYMYIYISIFIYIYIFLKSRFVLAENILRMFDFFFSLQFFAICACGKHRRKLQCSVVSKET